ncbi:unnamed protein product [Dicrocoelium dendriticum]|nr:unnamed protein product [Dicrocoelium dendriticum]
MTSLTYYVVSLSTSTVSTVTTISSSWLLGDGRRALLPNVPHLEYLNAVREHRPADENCTFADVTILRRSMDFDRAVALANSIDLSNLTEDTDSTADMGTLPHRLIRTPRRLISDDNDLEPPGKRMVTTAVPYGSPPIVSLNELTRSMSKNSRQSSSQQYNMNGYKQANTAFNTASHCRDNSNAQIRKLDSGDMDQLNDKVESIDGNVQKIMETLEYMKSCLSSMAATIAGQPGQQATQLPLPITSVEELQSFDILMQDAARRQQLHTYLEGVHGDTLSETVRLMMQRLLTRPLMAEINYSGSRNKHGFRKTKLFTEMQAALLKRFSESNVSPDGITQYVRN